MKYIIGSGLWVLLTLALTTASAHAAVMTVTDTTGELTTNQKCSITEAIENANAGGIVWGDCPPGSAGADTIKLEVNVTVRSFDVKYGGNGSNAIQSITTDITIDGATDTPGVNYSISKATGVGEECTPNGDVSSGTEIRLLHVGENGKLTIKNLTLENGCADGTDSQDDGGAIFNLGTLTIENSTLSQNNSNGSGGAIYNGDTATLSITDSEISNNATAGVLGGLGIGGGLANSGAVNGILNSTFLENTSGSGNGGAIHHSGEGSITLISGTTFSLNTTSTSGSESGGAIYAEADIDQIVNSTFSGNTTSGSGGAIYMEGASTTITTIKNSTFSANTAVNGSAIANFQATLENLINNVFAAKGSAYCIATGWGSINASNNLSDGDCPGDIGTVTNFDTVLKDNGGPTFTHALLPNSNAIDAGNSGEGVCTEQDQRGYYRRDDDCDIGAFEFGATRNPPSDNTDVAPINSLLLDN